MRKFVFIFLFLILFVNLFGSLVLSANVEDINENLGDTRENIDSTRESVEDVKDRVEDIREGRVDEDKQKWDYLAEEWPKIFLKNPVISAIDNFFHQIDFVFLVLMNVNYSFSFSFLFMIIVWIYLVFNIAYLLRATSIFGKGISWILSILIVALIGQGGFFNASVKWAGILFNSIVKVVDFVFLAIIVFIPLVYFIFTFAETGIFMSIRRFFENKFEKFKHQIEEDDKALFHLLTSKMYKAVTGKEKYKRHSSESAWGGII